MYIYLYIYICKKYHSLPINQTAICPTTALCSLQFPYRVENVMTINVQYQSCSHVTTTCTDNNGMALECPPTHMRLGADPVCDVEIGARLGWVWAPPKSS